MRSYLSRHFRQVICGFSTFLRAHVSTTFMNFSSHKHCSVLAECGRSILASINFGKRAEMKTYIFAWFKNTLRCREPLINEARGEGKRSVAFCAYMDPASFHFQCWKLDEASQSASLSWIP